MIRTITLLLALPRPHSLKKVLQQATAMGVKHFVLFACARVEASFFTASAVRPAARMGGATRIILQGRVGRFAPTRNQ